MKKDKDNERHIWCINYSVCLHEAVKSGEPFICDGCQWQHDNTAAARKLPALASCPL